MTRKELMEKAKSLGVEFSATVKNIELEDLISEAENKAEIEAKLKAVEAKDKEIDKQAAAKGIKPIEISKEMLERQRLAKKRKNALKLVRLRVNSLDTQKTEYPGEMFGILNSEIGSVKKFILFNEDWHMPAVLVNIIKSKQLLRTRKVKIAGKEVKEFFETPAYGVTILPDLTQAELDEVINHGKEGF